MLHSWCCNADFCSKGEQSHEPSASRKVCTPRSSVLLTCELGCVTAQAAVPGLDNSRLLVVQAQLAPLFTADVWLMGIPPAGEFTISSWKTERAAQACERLLLNTLKLARCA
jgi:hypothetical protein